VIPKEKQLCNAFTKAKNKLDYVASGRPIFCPADPKKLPDLINFAISKNIPINQKSAECLSDLSSDHSPVLFVLLRHPGTFKQSLKMTSQKTNWAKYRKYISSHIELSPHLNDEAYVDSFVNTLESVLVSAARVSTPQSTNTQCNQKNNSNSSSSDSGTISILMAPSPTPLINVCGFWDN